MRVQHCLATSAAEPPPNAGRPPNNSRRTASRASSASSSPADGAAGAATVAASGSPPPDGLGGVGFAVAEAAASFRSCRFCCLWGGTIRACAQRYLRVKPLEKPLEKPLVQFEFQSNNCRNETPDIDVVLHTRKRSLRKCARRSRVCVGERNGEGTEGQIQRNIPNGVIATGWGIIADADC